MQKRIVQNFPVYQIVLLIYNFFYYIATYLLYQLPTISIYYIFRLYHYIYLYIALK